MKLFKSVIGVFAVLFSIQSLAAWAASAETKSTSMKISINKGEVNSKEGGPTCIGGKN